MGEELQDKPNENSIEISNYSFLYQIGTLLVVVSIALSINMAKDSLISGFLFFMVALIISMLIMGVYNKLIPWSIPNTYLIGDNSLLIKTNDYGGKFKMNIHYENITQIKLKKLLYKKSIWIRYSININDDDLFIISAPGLTACNEKIKNFYNMIAEKLQK